MMDQSFLKFCQAAIPGDCQPDVENIAVVGIKSSFLNCKTIREMLFC